MVMIFIKEHNKNNESRQLNFLCKLFDPKLVPDLNEKKHALLQTIDAQKFDIEMSDQ